MACGNGLPAIDCAILHWSHVLDGRPEAGHWRAPCPLCQAHRALHYEVRGKSVRWQSFCGDHDREALRLVLSELLGPCVARRDLGPVPVSHDELATLALSGMQPQSMKLAMLEMAGFSTRSALDKLGVIRNNRSRVITGRFSVIKTDANPQVADVIKTDAPRPKGRHRKTHQNGCKPAGKRGLLHVAFICYRSDPRRG